MSKNVKILRNHKTISGILPDEVFEETRGFPR